MKKTNLQVVHLQNWTKLLSLREFGNLGQTMIHLKILQAELQKRRKKGTSHKNVFMNCIMRQDDKKWQLHSWSFQTGDINRNLA